jgi:nicotinamidase-related amidase
MAESDPSQALRFLRRPAVHLCIDMQRMFGEDTDWKTPWMARVLPVVERLAEHRPADTIFTRFLPPERPGRAAGAWGAYFGRWRHFCRDRIDPSLIDLMPPLQRFVPPAEILDKPAYSPFVDSRLDGILARRGAETLIVSGAETDVCVLSAVMSAIDRGFFVVVVRDALCSSADATHDALMKLYEDRFGQQLALTNSEAILAMWRD